MGDKTKKILGALSPAYGIATGEGLFGKLADKGLLGLGPRMIASEAQREREEKNPQKIGLAPIGSPAGGMKKGGVVKSSASKRADGCAQRGKTRGKVI